MKRDILDRQEFRKYSLYGVGELVLIVIGILIALQIDNWNSDKKQEESLRSYLDSIARNIRDDLSEIRTIREKRRTANELAVWQQSFIAESITSLRGSMEAFPKAGRGIQTYTRGIGQD